MTGSKESNDAAAAEGGVDKCNFGLAVSYRELPYHEFPHIVPEVHGVNLRPKMV
jgi:hypothetical protein